MALFHIDKYIVHLHTYVPYRKNYESTITLFRKCHCPTAQILFLMLLNPHIVSKHVQRIQPNAKRKVMHRNLQVVDLNYEFINGVSGKYTTEIVSKKLHRVSRYLLFTMSTEDLRTVVFVCTKLWVVLNYSTLQLKDMSFFHHNKWLSLKVLAVTVRTN